MPEFVKLLIRLIDAKVDFVLVGGLAAATHGCTLVTQDIDLCIDLDLSNLERLQQALSELHPVHRMTAQRVPFRHSPSELGELKNFYLHTDWGQLDCLGAIKGIGDFKAAVVNSEFVPLENRSFRILTLPALVQAKSALDRPRDAEVVRQLRMIMDHKTPS
jgi:hypothetical protein